MNLNGFYGNEPIKTVLNTHRFHAYLIEGPEGSGKHTLADRIANALVCDAPDPPCGECRQCYKFKNHCHPDVIDLSPDLPLEDLREQLARTVFPPNDAAHKVYRIDRAERLLPAAQNLLLKTLEEPPRDTVFLLLCPSRESLLETVRSRCQILSLAPLKEDDIRRYFLQTYGVYDEKARDAALLSAGFLGKAIEYYRNGESETVRACRELERLLRKRDAEGVFRALTFQSREELTDFYRAFTLHLRRRLREERGEDARRFFARLDRAWASAEEAMNTNVNVKFWGVNLARLCLNAVDPKGKGRN